MNRHIAISLVIVVLIFFVSFFIFFKTHNSINNEEFKHPVRVLFITDENYVMPVTTAIRSIAANKNKETQIEINIIGVDLSDIGMKKLFKENKKNIKINIINVPLDYLQGLPGGEDCKKIVSKADNAKFFLTSILKDKDKILYLDGDVIILKDLSEFYNIDLADNYIAAVDDWQTNWGENSKDRYFNNGIMLLNLKKMREDNIDAKLLNAKRNDKKKRFVTQDAYNKIMKSKIVFLPLTYNTFAPEFDNMLVHYMVQEVLGENFDPKLYPYDSAEDYRKNVVAIHYCGWNNIKPWWGVDFSTKTNRIWYKYAPLDFWIGCMQGKCKIPYRTSRKKRNIF